MTAGSDAIDSLVIPEADATVNAGEILESLGLIWQKATLEEKHRLLSGMLEAVYIDLAASRSGTSDAIRALEKMGFVLFTASGEHSRELDGYLKGMGVRGSFEVLYGSDLVNTAKSSDEYYHRVFVHAGIAPNQAMVVDDNPRYLAWASSLGARTCLVRRPPVDSAKADVTIAGLEELPVILHKIVRFKPRMNQL